MSYASDKLFFASPQDTVQILKLKFGNATGSGLDLIVDVTIGRALPFSGTPSLLECFPAADQVTEKK